MTNNPKKPTDDLNRKCSRNSVKKVLELDARNEIGRKKERLTAAFSAYLRAVGEQILSFDVAIARRWATLTVHWQRQGRRLSVLDSMIEATALHWSLTLVTRNTSDFVEARTVNPWAKT